MVQGLGNVGGTVVRELAQRGATIVGVSDVTGGVVNPDGLDIAAVKAWLDEHRFLRDFPGGTAVGRREILEQPCDILIPAAVEQQITRGQRRPDRRPLGRRGRERADHAGGRRDPGVARASWCCPDVLANAGGVTVSYFEWVQDQQKLAWQGAEVAARLRMQLDDAFARVLDAKEAARDRLAHGGAGCGDRARGGRLAPADDLSVGHRRRECDSAASGGRLATVWVVNASLLQSARRAE